MKLTFKTIAKKETFALDNVEGTQTVGKVKELIQEAQGFDASLQKLIYSGKILADDKTIESYAIKEKDFIVCMVSKPKAASKTAAPAEAPSTPAPAAQVPITPAPAQLTTPQAPAPAGAPTVDTRSGAFNDANAFAAGEARSSAVTMLMEMGYEKIEVEKAMRAAFNNPDRAADYLLTGIPESILREQAQAQQAQQVPATPTPAPATQPSQTSQPQPRAPVTGRPGNLFEAAAQHSQSGNAGSGATGEGDQNPQSLEFLRNDPQFLQLRNLIQTQPQMFEPILQQLSSSNPQLATLITSNPEQFLELLAGGDDGALPPSAQQIQVTPEEHAAIERLQALGFGQEMVIQAYFACDKNEELAANYLFDNGNEDDDDLV